MKESHKSLVSTFSKLDISQKKFGDRSSILSNLSKIGYPIVEGFFISYDMMKQVEIGQQTPQIPNKFLECGPFCLRSSTKKTQFAGLEPFLYLAHETKTCVCARPLPTGPKTFFVMTKTFLS